MNLVNRYWIWTALWGTCVLPFTAPAQTLNPLALPTRAPMLDAHNCYPDGGRWRDRIGRALGLGYPVAIEQDLAWHIDASTGLGRPVVSHATETTGLEPGLREHFFERVRPIVEEALRKNDRQSWPLIVLNLDFKDNRPELLEAVWRLLDDYEPWLSTAIKDSGNLSPQTIEVKPLLILTGDTNEQQTVFFDRLPSGARLRLFGSVQDLTLATSIKPTNYRRWWNLPWSAVEADGQPKAGDWTAAEQKRLQTLVDHAHRLGYAIRFYTLNGIPVNKNQGWSASYNFGSRDSVMRRWKSAKHAGVDFIATDQYEDLAGVLRAP